MPYALLLNAYTTLNGVPLARGRSSVWTVLPVLCADGTVLLCCIIEHCKSLPVDAVKFTSKNDICIGATENAQQTDEIWMQFFREWVPKCGCSWSRPDIVSIDRHSTHLRSEFIRFAAMHSLYVPSHTSMILQVAEVGVNRYLKTRYQSEYTSFLRTFGIANRLFDDTGRIG